MSFEQHRVILVDADEITREVFAQRLRMQGYTVELASSPAEGARLALAAPPAVVVADLWMPSISGVQLCRLLRSEPATEHVPVILRGPLGQRDRFWAERAGAAAYVGKGRMGDLARAIAAAIAGSTAHDEDSFFTHLAPGDVDVRDRIAAHLDAALFESVIASEIRNLSTCGDLERVFDLFSQLFSQLSSYRWIALRTGAPERFALHVNPAQRQSAEQEARRALGVAESVPVQRIEDEDARGESVGPPPIIQPIWLGQEQIGELAVACAETIQPSDEQLVALVARELGAPIRMAMLVEESQRLARIDSLTGLLNRRAFLPMLDVEIARSQRHGIALSFLLLDVDHFKSVNDVHGHATGDAVLQAIGKLLQGSFRKVDITARWGGEEFVVALCGTPSHSASEVGERVRRAIRALEVRGSDGQCLSLSASIGVATYRSGDNVASLVDRADRAMYQAKSSGRDRVCAMPSEAAPAAPAETGEATRSSSGIVQLEPARAPSDMSLAAMSPRRT